MSLASRYGGMIPRSQSVEPNALKVCVKTTRYILKKHVFVSPALKVDTTLPSTTVTSIAGHIYDTACRNKMEKVVQQYLDRVPKDADTQTVTTSLVDGVDASTQYSLDDLVTDTTPVRIPDIKSYETQSKNILKTMIGFFANFDKVGRGTTASADMITRMNEIVESMFTEDTDSIPSSVLTQAIPILISHPDLPSTITPMLPTTTEISPTVLTTDQDIAPVIEPTRMSSLSTNVNPSVSTSDTLCTSAPRHLNPLLKDLHDPLGKLENFIDLPWYDDSYKDKQFEGYEWYLLPPYIKLLLYHDHQINSIPMRKPSASVLVVAYAKANRQSETGEVTFYRSLIKRIERDQIKQIEDIIRSDPFVTNHPDPDHVLDSYISTPWYNRRPISFLSSVYE